MKRFDQVIEQILLLTEKKRKTKRRTIPKSKVTAKSQENRKDRAANVKIAEYKKLTIGGGQMTRHTCEATSAEQSESKKHKCRIDTFNKSGRIDDAACSCSDFQSRFRYYRNKEGIARWETVTPIKSIFDPHTKEKPEIMNPHDQGYMCKHLIAFVKKFDAKKKT